MNELSNELREMVFLLSQPKDIANCRMVCRQWNEEINGNCKLMKIIRSTIQISECFDMARKGNEYFFEAMVYWTPCPNKADVYGHIDDTPLYWQQ